MQIDKTRLRSVPVEGKGPFGDVGCTPKFLFSHLQKRITFRIRKGTGADQEYAIERRRKRVIDLMSNRRREPSESGYFVLGNQSLFNCAPFGDVQKRPQQVLHASLFRAANHYP